MSTALQDTSSSAYRLEATLPSWCALKAHHTLLCGMFIGAFLLLSYLPVSLPTTWHDVVMGRSVWSSSSDALANSLPLAEGMRHFTIGRGGLWIVAQLEHLGGPRLLAMALGVVGTLQLIVWARILFTMTGKWHWCLGTAPILAASMPEWSGLNRVVLGQAAFACFIWLLAGATERTSHRIRLASLSLARRLALTAIFCLWANLHASVLVGVIVLAILVLDRLWTLPESPTLATRLSDRELLSRLALLEIAFLATVINPEGIGLWKAMLWWPDQPFLAALGGWAPPTMAGTYALSLALGWMLWHRLVDHRTLQDWNLLAVAATLFVACSQFQIVWFAPLILVATVANCRHRREAVEVLSRGELTSNTERPPLQFAYTLLCGLLIWLGICFSPVSEFMGGRARDEASLVGQQLPVEAKRFLAQAPLQGLVFCPQRWSDYFLAQCQLQVFLAADNRRVPASVLNDYHRIFSAESNWNELAQKYAIQRMVVDKTTQSRLVRDLRRNVGDWKVLYEDEQALIVKKGNQRS